MIRILIISLIAIISGCSTIDTSRFSDGAKLMVDTKLAYKHEINEIIEKSSSNGKYTKDNGTSVGKAVETTAIGGVASSAVLFAGTGAWLNPKSFISSADVTLLVTNVLSGKGMKHHKWTYTYLYYISDSCDERACVNQAYETFYNKLIDSYAEVAAKRPNPPILGKRDFSGAIPIFNYITGKFDIKLHNEKRSWNYPILNIKDLDNINSIGNIEIWGNDSPHDFQDSISLPELTYEETTDLILEASKVDQNIVIFRGVDLAGLKKGSSCYGGFFVRGGAVINVPELGCNLAKK